MSVLGLFKQGLAIVDKAMPDSDKERELEQLLVQGQMSGQVKLNLQDGASDDPVRTRWRPMTCIGLAVAFLSWPLTLVADAWGLIGWIRGEPLTDAQLAALQAAAMITGPMLGYVLGLRGWEKAKGVG